ncbi:MULTISPECIES: pilus assembly protein [Rhodopseudomonas]|uniref:Pilus assembly protein TadG n=1 Tax=Rhodopseudomonas palustris TaxID=1076 RepID=A0A0D7EMA9_RHOPL|nr:MULTISPECIES: pilus assembly protein [Rhodopseudomonas]KIZ40592.1 pilus assembly protein TadG [Rhodopseudomonas palustris]MDF3809489.1 pilus assembly protein [Rhodopseudomonas sp. BAL398]WOK19371.1 pilus assembly protein [Rhodopseudomonas sp. BAL398]
MPIASLRSRLRTSAGGFSGAADGNVAVIFAIALLPILTFIGAAIDYSRASSARTSMQAALDSAALMVSKDLASGIINASDVPAKAQAYFNGLYNNTEATGVTVTASYTARNSKGQTTVVMNGAGAMPTDFLRVVGMSTLDFGSSSTATFGGTRLRVAMALDVTGSMASSGKMQAMKDAAKKLVDTLKSSATTADDLYISVVPFAQMVNVGASNKNASWLDWTDWDQTNGSCSSYWYSTKSSCESARKTWNPDNHNTWKGCVTDRDQPADTTNAAPTSSSTRFPAVQYEQNGSNICPEQILPMTSAFAASNVQTIKAKIDALDPNGGTNQPIGMAWAWQTLRPGDPLNTPPKDPNFAYTDAIILLSDGLNTMDRWPSYGNGQVQFNGQIDARQKLLCDNIKVPVDGKKTVVYTIQVNTDGDPESAILKYCADSGNFYGTSTAAGIGIAFAQIGASLAKLRIAK